MQRATLVSAATFALFAAPGIGAAAHDATPTPSDRCEEVGTAGTPAAMPHDMAGMAMGGTPMAEMDRSGMDHTMMELDQMHIDMMIPHHESIIVVAEAALPRLHDERLRDIAQAVVDTQQPEIDELRALRERIYGDPEPMPMDAAMTEAMGNVMPGMGSMDEMAFQMDAAAQVAAFCAAEDADLAFIDLTILHHEVAVDSSRQVVEQGVHPEVRDFAQRVIEAQQREIETLAEVRQELYGSATPEPVDS